MTYCRLDTFHLILMCIGWIVMNSSTSIGMHIIGGVVTYECLGDNRYEITMKVYRDCQGGGAGFDSNGTTIGTVTIFEGDAIYERYRSIQLDPALITFINPEDNPCLSVPPNVCVEEGEYKFTVTLPRSPDAYTITYQRCCRNNTITNIANPGESGATYFVQITPEAQAICNSSPVFNDFPPIVICGGELLTFDHSATDPDNDPNTVLVYSLCTPYLGGGLRGATAATSGQAHLPDGVAPDPDVGPPYIPLNYFEPYYSSDNPLGEAASISIDPNTGRLSVQAGALGQYVIGVCVQEFRNGVLISEIQRDFQFNVGQCNRLVRAEIQADSVREDGVYIIRLCGSTAAHILNLSSEQFIDSYDWYVEETGDQLKTRDFDYTFPDTGIYHLRLVLNKDQTFAQCQDSILIEVGVFGEISVSMDYAYDTCVHEQVSFSSQSHTENGVIESFNWIFGDGATADQPQTTHLYDSAATYLVQIQVTDARGCTAEDSKLLRYYPVPSQVIIEPDHTNGCTPATIYFDNLSALLTEEYLVEWLFGDGQSDEGVKVSHLYDTSGIFDVNVYITSPIGCETSAQFDAIVDIRQSPIAMMEYTPEILHELQRDVQFNNLTKHGQTYHWSFGDGTTSSEVHPFHTYADTGYYDLRLVAYASNGCSDTLERIMDVAPLGIYHLPNAFTPNDDGVNDIYVGNGLMRGVRSYSMTIWNRWGEKVFESDDPTVGWDGRTRSGEPAPKGNYLCVVEFVTSRREHKSLESTVTLLR